jgi:hypothetical protein
LVETTKAMMNTSKDFLSSRITMLKFTIIINKMLLC